MKHIWVVEMRINNGSFAPTVGVALSRRMGRLILRNLHIRNPDDVFRLRKYVGAK